MSLVLLRKALGVGTYHLQNPESLEPFLLLLGEVIVHMAAVLSTGDILLAQSVHNLCNRFSRFGR